jgi:DNA-binding CsgD family transcriptional regulator
MLNLISRGFKYAEVSAMKGISINTVHTHIRNIYAKLSVNSRSEAVFEAGRLGLLGDLFRRDDKG